LAILVSNLKVPLPPNLRYDIEVKCIPFVPDNVKHWKVFEDDLEIRKFLESIDEFSALHIDQDHDPEGDPHPKVFLNNIVDHCIVQLLSNHIPKGLVLLERPFYRNDVAVKGKVSDDNANVMEFNIGTKEDPKFVKLSRSLSKKQRAEYTKLLREFTEVFAWTYEDLKT
jgi:hypothetical protein